MVPRLAYTLMKGTEAPPLSEAWSDTVVALPEGCELDHFRNVFDGSTVTASGARGLLCRELFAHFPLALLTTP